MNATTQAAPPMLDAALGYAARGWPVFPLHNPLFGADGNHVGCSCGRKECTPADESGGKGAGKHPRTPNGFKDATTYEATIRARWRDWPDANIGIPTGPASGLLMIGPDGPEGREQFRDLCRRHGADADALGGARATTQGGGEHYLFAYPPGRKVTTRANHNGLRVDVRGEGGYFVAAPSRGAFGDYAWDDPGPEPLPRAAGWLEDWAATKERQPESAEPPRQNAPPRHDLPPDAERVRRARAYIAKIPGGAQGQNGSDPCMLAARVLVWGFGVEWGAAFDLMKREYSPRCSPPWEDHEIRHKIECAAKPDGFGKPFLWLLNAPPSDGAAPRAGGSQGAADRRQGGAADDAGSPNPGGAGDGGKKEKAPPAAEVLAGVGAEADLFHDAAGRAYATVGRRTYPVRSTGFRLHLICQYRKRTGKVPNGDAVGAAVSAVEAAAVHDGPERPAAVRVAGHGGKVYYHLGDDDTTVIEVDAGGWRACPDPPVRFVKPPGMFAVPPPARGGDFAAVRRFVNCPGAAGFALLRGWVSAALSPAGPFPLLGVTGEQGSAKTTTTRLLKDLLDPGKAPVRSAPREERDLQVAAAGNWVLAYDNLSGVPDWLSDALCRLSTGGGFATRTLYADAEETVFEAKRPVILNGIDDPASRPDLLERMVILRHPRIPEGERRLESDLWAEFEAARPGLLGAVLDRVSAGLRALPRVDKSRLPRMADACAFAAACELGMGEEPAFLDAFRANQRDGHEMALADSPVVGPLLGLMGGRDEWRGSPTDLHAALTKLAPDPRPRDWPKQANGLTNRLRRLAPSLARVHGLHVDADGRADDQTRARFVRVARRADGAPDSPSTPSGPSDPAADGQTGARDDRPETGGDRPRPSKEKPTKGSVSDGPDGVDGVSPLPQEADPAPAGGGRWRSNDRPEEAR